MLPLFVVYFVSGVAETNRAVRRGRGESEIVAGHMVEYSGSAFALFFLAEYANMIWSFPDRDLLHGRRLSPLQGLGVPWLSATAGGGCSPRWFLRQLLHLVPCTFPRYRYDRSCGWAEGVHPAVHRLDRGDVAYYGIFEAGGDGQAVHGSGTAADRMLRAWLTKYLFRPKYTLMYPMEKTPQSPRFRGLHAAPL